VVRTFDYPLPPGNTIVDVTVTAKWGSSLQDFTAPTRVFVDGVEVASCAEGERCWLQDEQWDGWSFSFAGAGVPDFAALFADGTLELSVIQDGPFLAQFTDFALTIVTEPTP
jgi:hypothetical protein